MEQRVTTSYFLFKKSRISLTSVNNKSFYKLAANVFLCGWTFGKEPRNIKKKENHKSSFDSQTFFRPTENSRECHKYRKLLSIRI